MWMDAHDPFREAIRAAPDDDGPRLVYADWLLEHGNEAGQARGRFIHVQIQLARMSAKDRRRAKLEAEERKLQKKWGEYWAAPLWDLIAEWRFERGFIERVEIKALATSATHLLKHLREWEPVRHVRFRGEYLEPPRIAKEAHHLAGIETLELHEFGLVAPGLRDGLVELLTSPHLSAVRELRALSSGLGDGPLDDEAFAAVVRSPHLNELHRLSLYQYARGNSPENLEALAASPHLPRLEDLDLRDGRPTEAALRALVASPHRAALKTFRARGVLVVEDRVRYLSEHRPLRRALLERFGEQALDFRTRYPWWKGQSWTDRALAHTPLS
jgi:uncharacterized protein (TIGR02996 family)